MRAVIQRVSRAAVRVDGQSVGAIGRGLLVLLGIGKSDTETASDWMIKKLLNLRIFPDDAGKMNRSVTDIDGCILVVSQFTLYGELEKGTRPSFSEAMPPAKAEQFYHEFMTKLRAATRLKVAEGKFAAMMDVELVNDGPVTIVLESPVERASRPFIIPQTGETPVPLFIPFDAETPVTIHWRNLPHWQQPGSTYFVTFRLADSLPHEKLEHWLVERELWLKQNPPPHSEELRRDFHEQFAARLEQWLDAGHGACWLRQPAIAALVEQALRHFDGQRYQLGDFVIMPNHVHALVTPVDEWSLEQIVHSWKSYTEHEINKRLERTGKVWQEEYFDHLVRNEAALEQYAAYIRQNPAVERASRPFAK
jgi:D-tyrosyl-tRNA(Tyr) deacylase